MVDRAKQFLPFDALKGFKEALKEKEIVLVDQKELLEDEIELLNQKIIQLKTGMMIQVVYFNKREYIKVIGLVSKINFIEKYVIVITTKIYFKDIISLNSEEFID